MERPTVTVVDPSGAGRPPDLLEAGPRRPGPRRPAVRPLLAVLAVALLVAGVLVALDQHGDQRAGDRARRAADAAVLEVPTGGYSARTSVAPDDPVAQVRVDVRVRNPGEVPLLVERASLGGLLSTAAVEILPGEQEVLRLRRSVRCSPVGDVPPGEDDVSGGLRARVRVAGLVRDLRVQAAEVPFDRVARLGQEACGFLPLEESVRVQALALQSESGQTYVQLELVNSSVRAVRLVRLSFAPGLEVRDLDGGSLVLPVELPRAERGLAVGQSLAVGLAVRCDELRADGADALDQVSVLLDDGDGQAVGPLLSTVEGAQLLRQLVVDLC